MASSFPRLAFTLLAVVGLSALTSCGDRRSLAPTGDGSPTITPAADETAEPATSGATATPAGPSAVSLRTVDEKQFTQALGEYRGKVVLVDCWATWCLECVKLFSHTVNLHQAHAGDGLVVVSLSFDDPEDAEKAKALLAEKGATFPNFITAYDPMKAVEAFEIPDGSLPHFRLYDREGNLVKSFSQGMDGPLDVREIDRAVEEQLKR